MESEGTVYVVDDDISLRKGLSRLLSANGRKVETYGSAEEFLKQAKISHPSCLILDVSMPGLNGIQLQTLLSRNQVQIPVIFLTGTGDVPVAVDAMRRGASDFLTKPVSEAELVAALERAFEQDVEGVQREAERRAILKNVDTLTEREREVLTYVIAGLLNKQIAERMGTAEKTVKVHRGRMVRKMQAESVADLVRKAEKVGIQPAD